MAETAPSNVKEITSYEEFKKIIDGDKPALVDYYATWCGPCKVISPKFEQMSALEGNKDIDFYKVDVDAQPEISEAAGIRAMPTFILYKKGELSDSASPGKGSKSVLGANPQELQALVVHAGGVSS